MDVKISINTYFSACNSDELFHDVFISIHSLCLKYAIIESNTIEDAISNLSIKDFSANKCKILIFKTKNQELNAVILSDS